MKFMLIFTFTLCLFQLGLCLKDQNIRSTLAANSTLSNNATKVQRKSFTKVNEALDSNDKVSHFGKTETETLAIIKTQPHHMTHHKTMAFRNSASDSLSLFILALLFIFISLIVIYYNEYRALKFTEYIDILENDSTSQEVIEAAEYDFERDPEAADKVFVIFGFLNMNRAASIPGLESLPLPYPNKILSIKMVIDEYINESELIFHGHEEIAGGFHGWKETHVAYCDQINTKVDDKYKTQYFTAEDVVIGNSYKFDKKLLERLVDSCQINQQGEKTCSPDKKNVFSFYPEDNDEEVKKQFEHYFQNDNGEISVQVFIQEGYIYIIHERKKIENFNAHTFKFKSVKDLRLRILYYYAEEDDFRPTIVGRVNPVKDHLGHYHLESFVTNISKPDLLCCLADFGNNYEYHILYPSVYSRSDVVKQLYSENRFWTLRWIGIAFLLFGFYCYFYSYSIQSKYETNYPYTFYPFKLSIDYITTLKDTNILKLLMLTMYVSFFSFCSLIALLWICIRFKLSLLLILILTLSHIGLRKYVFDNDLPRSTTAVELEKNTKSDRNTNRSNNATSSINSRRVSVVSFLQKISKLKTSLNNTLESSKKDILDTNDNDIEDDNGYYNPLKQVSRIIKSTPDNFFQFPFRPMKLD